jgi:hypothetical protein
MTKFGTSTNGARIQLRSNGDRGDTLRELVQVGHTARVKMTKTLMPQNAKLVAIQMTQLIHGIIVSG